jgi:hypothetical protein
MTLLDTFVASYAVTLCVLLIVVPLWSESKGFATGILAISAVISALAYVAVNYDVLAYVAVRL